MFVEVRMRKQTCDFLQIWDGKLKSQLGPKVNTLICFNVGVMEQQVQGQFSYHKAQLIKTEPLGNGSYGAVYKATCDNLLCAGKILNHIFF